jgi:hypothetical protein
MTEVQFAFPPTSRICPVDAAQYCTLLLQADSALYVDVRRRLSVSFNENKVEVEGFASYRLDDLRNGTAFPPNVSALFTVGSSTMSTLETIVRYVAITHAIAARTVVFTTFDPVDYMKMALPSVTGKWTDGFGEYASIQSLLATKAADVPLLCVLDTTILLVLPFDATNAVAPCRFLQEVPTSPDGKPLFNNQDGTDRRLVNRSVSVSTNSVNWWPHIPDTYSFKDAQSRFDVSCYRQIPDGPLNKNGQERGLIDLAVSAYGFYGRFRPPSATDAGSVYDSGVYMNRTMFPYWVDASGAGVGGAFVRGNASTSSSQVYPQLDYVRWGYTYAIAATRVVLCNLSLASLSSASFQIWMYPTSEFMYGALLFDSTAVTLNQSCIVCQLSQPTAFRYFEWRNTTPSDAQSFWRSNFGIYLA